MPNTIVFTSPVQVLTGRPQPVTDWAIGVDYNTPLPMARETLVRAIQEIEGIYPDPEPKVEVSGCGDSAIDGVVRYWRAPQRVETRRIQTQAAMALKQACDRNHISIPYPIRPV
ncbi:MAG: mechanosensitive ion channel family protein [Acaryochloridaceae cyanobacterium SU_2_1]|nr:mechanosensitive ion channel family protein [Acaryochloridaceae cyanobacterium SU_2_1]NJM95025.1 mechanosensitive ion channel family protein [Acaryochloridaceae cyanobacterium CSU_5_19]